MESRIPTPIVHHTEMTSYMLIHKRVVPCKDYKSEVRSPTEQHNEALLLTALRCSQNEFLYEVSCTMQNYKSEVRSPTGQHNGSITVNLTEMFTKCI